MFTVDYQNDLCITYDQSVGDDFPESPELPDYVNDYAEGVFLGLAAACDGLEHLAERSAAAIRAITGYTPGRLRRRPRPGSTTSTPALPAPW